MPGGKLVAGPFVGGLSTQSDPAAIADTELAVLENFEVDVDGSLKTRPPFVDRGTALTLATAGGNPQLLGYYVKTDGTQQAIYSDGLSSVYYLNGTTPTLINNNIQAIGITQFGGQLHVLCAPGGAGVGGRWDGTTWTADANMPKGESMVAYKSRLWIAAGRSSTTPTRMYYSAVLGGTLWSGGNVFIEINAGDGQALVALFVLNNSILIFRTNSTWQFTYSTDPIYGQQNVILPDIGLVDAKALDILEGVLYFIYAGRAYAYSGGSVTQINPRVPFISTARANIYSPYVVSVFNGRILFSFWNILYVFNTKSRSWSTWTTSYGGIGKILTRTPSGDAPTAYALSNVLVPVTGSARTAKLLYFTDDFTNEAEFTSYTCTMQTKTYDFGAASQYKRLFWWGANVIVRGTLRAVAKPDVYASPITWGALRTAGRTWGQSLVYTWGAPAVGDLSATTDVVATASAFGPQAKFIRFMRNLRGRRLLFRVQMTVDGSSNSAPGRVFNLELFLSVKERVSQSVT